MIQILIMLITLNTFLKKPKFPSTKHLIVCKNKYKNNVLFHIIFLAITPLSGLTIVELIEIM